MTPCEELGYKAGDLFACNGNTWFERGVVVVLKEDDGSEIPPFGLKSDIEISRYIYLRDVTPCRAGGFGQIVGDMMDSYRETAKRQFDSAKGNDMTNKVIAPDILDAAAGHLRDRAVTYDKPDGERSMGATCDAFFCVSGLYLTAEQGWLFMAILKMVRAQSGNYRADSYEDGAAYFALAGESAAEDRAVTDTAREVNNGN